jgi:hypothetical protein
MDFESVSNRYKCVATCDCISDLVNRNFSCDGGTTCSSDVCDYARIIRVFLRRTTGNYGA